MSEKKPKRTGRPPKHPAQDAGGRSGSPMSLRLDPELRALMPQFQALYKKRNDIKLDLVDVIELGLRRLFREFGLLPPPE